MRKTRPPLTTAVVTLIAGCLAMPTVLARADQAGSSVERREPAPPGQIQQVMDFLNSWQASWTTYDPTVYAAQYTEDAEFVTPDGQVFSGREAIRALHEFVFAGEFAGTDFLADVRRIVFLTGTVATVSLDVRVISPVQPTPVFFVRIQLVVVKQRGEWLIANQQITAVPPQPV